MKYGKAKSSKPEGMSKERMAQISGNLKKAVDKSKEKKLSSTSNKPSATIQRIVTTVKSDGTKTTAYGKPTAMKTKSISAKKFYKP